MALLRSEYEIVVAEDYDLSIVVSATALEWQLAFLHSKWTGIGALDDGREMSSEEIEKIWRSKRNFFEKLGTTGRLLHSRGFEAYVHASEQFRGAVSSDFPSLDIDGLPRSIHCHVIVPRNRILHSGHQGFAKEDAVRAHNIARLGVTILHSMDLERREVP